LEDDWEFYASGFIEKSLAILEENLDCIQVWLRALRDTMGHPINQHVYRTRGVRWRKLETGYNIEWHGFSFNPGLRRLLDYNAIGGYSKHADFDFVEPHKAEATISCLYKEKGFFAAILADRWWGAGYVRHIGNGRHVGGF
jgi:hypothetical protein